MGSTTICAYCDEEFEATGRKKYCSKKCQYMAYYKANAERIKIRQKAYYMANIDKCKAWQNSYHHANAEKDNIRNKAYYKSNTNKVKALQKKYREANPDKIKSKDQKRYAIKKNAARAESFTNMEIFARDQWRCQHCGTRVRVNVAREAKNKANIDHIIPLSCGGTHTFDNVQTLCFPCNVRKGNRVLPGTDQLRLAI